MATVKIDIPGQHVEAVRESIGIELGSAGEDLGWGDYRSQREAGEYARAVLDAMDQVGWERAESCTLMADRKLMDDVFTRAFESAKERVREADADGMPDLLARLEWLVQAKAAVDGEAMSV